MYPVIPPPPIIQNTRRISESPSNQNGVAMVTMSLLSNQNGVGTVTMSHYDSPKSIHASQAMEDYDYPRGSKRSSPAHLEGGGTTLTAVPSQLKRVSDSSSGGSHVSLSSGSIFSADTSSGSLDLSLSGGAGGGGRELPGYDVPKSTPHHHASPMTSSVIRQSEVNLDDELRKIDGLMEEVAQQQQQQAQQRVIRETPSVTSANRVTLDGYEISGLGKHLVAGGESKRSSSSNQESLSSRSGSNDTLGVWDDVSFHDEEEEEESGDSEEMDGEAAVVGGGAAGGVVDAGDEGGTMLDSWIKELESGMQGMSGVAGSAAVGDVVSCT